MLICSSWATLTEPAVSRRQCWGSCYLLGIARQQGGAGPSSRSWSGGSMHWGLCFRPQTLLCSLADSFRQEAGLGAMLAVSWPRQWEEVGKVETPTAYPHPQLCWLKCEGPGLVQGALLDRSSQIFPSHFFPPRVPYWTLSVPCTSLSKK